MPQQRSASRQCVAAHLPTKVALSLHTSPHARTSCKRGLRRCLGGGVRRAGAPAAGRRARRRGQSAAAPTRAAAPRAGCPPDRASCGARCRRRQTPCAVCCQAPHRFSRSEATGGTPSDPRGLDTHHPPHSSTGASAGGARLGLRGSPGRLQGAARHPTEQAATSAAGRPL